MEANELFGKLINVCLEYVRTNEVTTEAVGGAIYGLSRCLRAMAEICGDTEEITESIVVPLLLKLSHRKMINDNKQNRI